ncbi:MAG: trp operon repressor [Holosporales bacterium]|nr:trp operon repressor [Holosporales bacterium]
MWDKGLFEIIAMIESADEAEKFLLDLCTPQELKAMKERWQVCQMLECGKLSYREISNAIGASTTTVTRVARFLNSEPYGGYRSLITKIKSEGKNV